VTGATGFLGKHLVGRLTGPVRVLVRGASPFDCEVVRGDITVAEDVDRAVKGCGRIYHLAGLVSRQAVDAPKMEQIHVEGTRLLLESARRHGVERVVVASSSGAVAVSRAATVHTEESGYKNVETARWPYYVTKIAQEKLAHEFYAKTKLPIVVANPSLLLGPGDERGSSTGDVVDFLEGQVLSAPAGGLNFVDARDAAAGIECAMQRGRAGERYLLGGVNWTCGQFLTELAKLSGRRAPAMTSPAWLSLLMAPILRKVMRKFTIDDATIEMSGLFWYCDSAKAERELGFKARDPIETLRDTVEDIYTRRPELKRA
jgi:dihydroflavonol-4-reductase